MNAEAAPAALDRAACRKILHDQDFAVIDLGAHFAQIEAASGVAIPHVRAQIARLLFFVRGEEHVALRRATLAFFRPAIVAAWQPVIAACAQTVTAALAPDSAIDHPVDLVTEFAAPICGQSICRMLGLPVSRSPEFDRWAEDIRWLTEPMLSLRRVRAIETSLAEFAAAIAEAMAGPPSPETEGRPTFLHHANADLSDEDRLWLTAVLYAAGQSTLHTLANIILQIATLPAQTRAPLSDPALLMQLVDRLLASAGSIQFISRLDRSGRRLDLPLAAVNRDSLAGCCPLDPDALKAPSHLAFGAGAHKCIGTLVARLIIGEALASLNRRYPDFALVKPPERFQSSTVIASPCDLLCTLQ